MPSDREPEPDESVEYYLAKARELLNPPEDADEFDRVITKRKAKETGQPFVDFREFEPEKDALDTLPAEIARRHHAVPIMLVNGILFVAMVETTDLNAMDAIKLATRLMVRCVLAPPRQIERALARYYPTPES